MKQTYNLTANTTGLKIGWAHQVRGNVFYFGTVTISGTFGAGTVAVFISPDNGTTLIPAKNLSGTAFTATANDSVNIQAGFGSPTPTIGSTVNSPNTQTGQLSIWVTLTGATTPNINVSLFDNS